ncbi:hypothetical protein [Ekhidna sp. To15]|uniref:hypothetical protein n=1 Tax=Ekhidna sp. To15 TaxID=3395267 RepID=UPI003F523167
MISKSTIRAAFLDLFEQKIADIKAELEAVKDSATSETKSSMGDKYETSREMMMQERNRLGSQMEIMMTQVAALSRIDTDKNYSKVSYGCLVQTDGATFFISTAAGQLKIEKQIVFAISGEAPLSKAMMGRKIGDSFIFNGKSFNVKDIK